MQHNNSVLKCVCVCVCVCVCERERQTDGRTDGDRTCMCVCHLMLRDMMWQINEESHRVPWRVFLLEGLQ